MRGNDYATGSRILGVDMVMVVVVTLVTIELKEEDFSAIGWLIWSWMVTVYSGNVCRCGCDCNKIEGWGNDGDGRQCYVLWLQYLMTVAKESQGQ